MKQNENLTKATGKPSIKGAMDEEDLDTSPGVRKWDDIRQAKGAPERGSAEYAAGQQAIHDAVEPTEGTNVEDAEGRPIE